MLFCFCIDFDKLLFKNIVIFTNEILLVKCTRCTTKENIDIENVDCYFMTFNRLLASPGQHLPFFFNLLSW